MKKNYTLKITLTMLFVVLVSLVSFVGVYKGKNLIKGYSFGKDFNGHKVAIFSVKKENTTENTSNENTTDEKTTNENTATENTTDEKTTNENTVAENATDENTTNENKTGENDKNNENDIKKKYEISKNVINKRLAYLNANEYDIRLNEDDGTIAIDVPSDMNSSYIGEIISKGKIQIKNTSTSEVIVDSNGFKDASAKINTTSSNYSKPIIELNIKLTEDAKNIMKNANTKYTDSEGKESDATFELNIDGTSLYSDSAPSFVSTAKNGLLNLVFGQSDTGDGIEENYKSAQILVSLIKYGELPVEYEAKSINIVSSDIKLKEIIIFAIIVASVMIIYAIFKFRKKAILPMLSLIGLCATILLIIRYTNVTITLFTILGIALVMIANYIFVIKNLKNEKDFKQNFKDLFRCSIPVILIAIVFCCAPYMQLSTLGMSLFWGIIASYVYNVIITRVLLEK